MLAAGSWEQTYGCARALFVGCHRGSCKRECKADARYKETDYVTTVWTKMKWFGRCTKRQQDEIDR